jgi:N-dimethylarginine dimethylaminohydrolase
MTAPLRRVLVRQPPTDVSGWRELGWRAEPDAARLAVEHEAFCGLLEAAGAEVVVAPPAGLDAIYAFDPVLVAERGAVLLRPGKELRREEAASLRPTLAAAEVPVVGELEQPALVEGGDLIRLGERTLLAGRGYRTNSTGIRSLERILGFEALEFDLPHWHGPGEVMHLLSLLSPLDEDLVVAYLPLLPVRLAQLLVERGVEIVTVPANEFETMACNALALGPRRALVVDGNPVTRRRLEAAGVEVVAYRGEELSKGDGGPTCLTLPLLRA